MKKQVMFLLFASILCLPIFNNSALAESTKIVTFDENKTQKGRVVFVKPADAKIIELDINGKKTWEFNIPRKYQNPNFSLSAGPDIEWLDKTDTFLVAIPKVGIIEVNREGKVIWDYMTKDISHDVDLLSDGTLIFVNGWDSDSDYVLTRINRKGEVLERYTADDIGLNREERRWNDNIPGRIAEPYSNTHANSVQDLGGNKYLFSLRNYHRAVVVENGKIVNSYSQAKLIHDPVDVGDRVYFLRHEAVGDSRIVMHDKQTGKRSPVFNSPDASWTPMRTLEILKNGNFLITGSSVIAQVTKNGEVVWQLNLPNFDHQVLSKNKNKNVVYKAAFVYK